MKTGLAAAAAAAARQPAARFSAYWHAAVSAWKMRAWKAPAAGIAAVHFRNVVSIC